MAINLGNSSAVTSPEANTFLISAMTWAWLSLSSSSAMLVFNLVYGVDQPQGPLPHHLLASVDLTEDINDGPLGVPPDEGHDAVLDDCDLPMVLRLRQLYQNIHILGHILR